MTDPPNALHVGFQHHQAGRLREAEAMYREVLSRNADDPTANYLLGVLAHQAGRLAESLALLETAARLAPAEADVQNYRSIALRESGRFGEAIDAARRAVAARPAMVEAHVNLGIALQQSGDLAGAAGAYDAAIRVDPKYAAAHNNLGNIHQASGRFAEAEAAYRRAAELDPQRADAYNNLGSVLQELGRPDDAVEACQRAIALGPAFPPAHNNLGNALRERGESDAAIAAYRRAIELRADYAKAHSNLLFALHFNPAYDARSIRAEHERWAASQAEPLTRAAAAATPLIVRDRSPDRRLRIGYVSADFREHPVGRFMLPIVARHDRARFETAVYSDVRGGGDPVTAAIARQADRFVDVAALDDASLAARVRAEEVDLLIDLALHSGRNRLLAFARRAAPVQITYLGYPGTSGMSAMDYRLSDPHLDPPGAGADAVYTERSLRLPHTYWCYVPPPNLPDVAPQPPAAGNGFVTFGCLNQFTKTSDASLRTWATLLSRVPDARLLLHAPVGVARERVLAIMAAAGVAAARVEFVGRQRAIDYLATYHRIDVALDPFPYNGGTTTCEALLMGVPVVTLAGDCAVRRSGTSILANVGLGELVATKPEAYIDAAASLASNARRLHELRARLRPSMLASPLMDLNRFVRDLEDAYRTMWRELATGRRGTA